MRDCEKSGIYDMTSHEFSCAKNLGDYVSPAWDAEYAPKVRCFFDWYDATGRPYPDADMAEMIAGEMEDKRDDGELTPDALEEKNSRRARNRIRRRRVVDAMLERFGYTPSPAELDAYGKRFAAFEAHMEEVRGEMRAAREGRIP